LSPFHWPRWLFRPARARAAATFFRNPANITMDTDDVETVDFNASGGPATSPSTT